MTQFLRDQAIDSEEVVTPLMLDGTYLSRNFATLGPMIRQPPCDLKTPEKCLAVMSLSFFTLLFIFLSIISYLFFHILDFLFLLLFNTTAPLLLSLTSYTLFSSLTFVYPLYHILSDYWYLPFTSLLFSIIPYYLLCLLPIISIFPYYLYGPLLLLYLLFYLYIFTIIFISFNLFISLFPSLNSFIEASCGFCLFLLILCLYTFKSWIGFFFSFYPRIPLISIIQSLIGFYFILKSTTFLLAFS